MIIRVIGWRAFLRICLRNELDERQRRALQEIVNYWGSLVEKRVRARAEKATTFGIQKLAIFTFEERKIVIEALKEVLSAFNSYRKSRSLKEILKESLEEIFPDTN